MDDLQAVMHYIIAALFAWIIWFLSSYVNISSNEYVSASIRKSMLLPYILVLTGIVALVYVNKLFK